MLFFCVICAGQYESMRTFLFALAVAVVWPSAHALRHLTASLSYLEAVYPVSLGDRAVFSGVYGTDPETGQSLVFADLFDVNAGGWTQNVKSPLAFGVAGVVAGGQVFFDVVRFVASPFRRTLIREARA